MDRLTDAELRVMEVLWQQGQAPAGEIARVLKEQMGWNRNTSYTLLKRCVEKGAVSREDPGFVCRPLVERENVQRVEAEALLDRMFDGSQSLFFASMLSGRKLSTGEVERLHALIDEAARGEAGKEADQ